MSSAMYYLDSNDFVKGLIIAVLGAVFATLAQWLEMPGFEFGSFQYGELFKVATSAALIYLTKNFFTDESGKVFGSIG